MEEDPAAAAAARGEPHAAADGDVVAWKGDGLRSSGAWRALKACADIRSAVAVKAAWYCAAPALRNVGLRV